MKQFHIQTSNVPRETFESIKNLSFTYQEPLTLYLNQLLWWNKRVNLVSRNVSRETVMNHIQHSLVLSNFNAFDLSDTIVDAGTGGGLPGIPLAITHPDKHFILNDIVSKKCLAVKQIVRELGLNNVAVNDGSIADIVIKDPFLLVSKHAFKISELYSMTSHLPWKKMILYKGMNFQEELQNMDTSFQIHRYNLSKGDDFYTNKALLILSRD